VRILLLHIETETTLKETTLNKCAYFWKTEEGTTLQTPALNGAPVSPNSDVRTESLFLQLKLANQEVLYEWLQRQDIFIAHKNYST
jgi:hypothetical protein